MSDEITGGCLCGCVRYRARPPFRQIIACHCRFCRKHTGHHMAAAAALRKNFELLSDDSLTWFSSASGSRRGFCNVCGSTLFIEKLGSDRVAFAAGSINGPTNLELTTHIFVDQKGDYYDLPDDCEAHEGSFPPAQEVPKE